MRHSLELLLYLAVFQLFYLYLSLSAFILQVNSLNVISVSWFHFDVNMVLLNTVNLHRASKYELMTLPQKSILRACPCVHQAGQLHAISPISMKLSQYKGSTPKLRKTHWFRFWIFQGGGRSSPWFY